MMYLILQSNDKYTTFQLPIFYLFINIYIFIGQSAVIKLVDRETLLKEIKEKKQVN